jgi:nucleoside-diphosphate-sugar epimerase
MTGAGTADAPTLVTGGTGVIGGALVRALLERGARVRVLTRSMSRAAGRVPPGVELIEGDVADPSTAPRAVRGCRRVFHLAGPFREANIPERRYWEVQRDGTAHMLAAARAEGVERFIHTSTVGVLGHIANPPADEQSPYNPGDAYQRSKAAGERLALEFAERHDFPVAIIRPASVYGPGDRRFLKLFRSIQRGWFVMVGSGRPKLHLIYLDDLVRGYLLVASHPDAIGNVTIVAGPESHTLTNLVRLIADVLGAPHPRFRVPAWPVQLAGSICEGICVPLGISPPIYRRRVDFFTKSRDFRIDRARGLGFEPCVGVREGIERTAAWYRAEGLLN